MKNPLLDYDFLKQLYYHSEKEIYARIVALNTYEEPVEEITGKVTGGSINVDGNSAVRRTCSLSMVAYDIKLTDYYWGVKTKFNLSIGLKNNINKKYPDIIWFPQGVFLITSFNSSQSVNSFNISLSGKDKMCLLNGEISGSIHANSTRFDEIDETQEDGSVLKIKIPVKEIIREAVHTYANEPMHNIIINDVDDFGVEILEYRGSENNPLYILFKQNTDNIINISLTGPTNEDFKFKDLTSNNGFFSGTNGDVWSWGDQPCNVAKIEFGQTAGYKIFNLIYPDELTANMGEAITSILDKIKNFLGEFEYFYDVDGRFIFQKKKTYINTSWNNLRTGIDGVSYAEAAVYQTPITWSFEGNKMLTSISNNPALNNLKNDFSIWGTRKSISGADIPIHLRYSIDKKPTIFKNYKGEIFTSAEYDYRELIYQMAIDYRKNNRKDDFVPKLIQNNPELCARGRTGYEQYYIDMEGFWRQLYDPTYEFDYSDDTNNEYFKPGTVSQYWHKNVVNNPTSLNFWIDFLDTDGDISKFSIPAIGDRASVTNDDSVKAIYFKDTPLIIYYEPSEIDDVRYKKSGYSYAQLEGISHLFTRSTQGKSAKEALDSLLYNFTYCSETISLSSIPIYTLQPNTHISVKDDENIGINGEFIVSRITIPLNYNGLMSISATKVPEKIL